MATKTHIQAVHALVPRREMCVGESCREGGGDESDEHRESKESGVPTRAGAGGERGGGGRDTNAKLIRAARPIPFQLSRVTALILGLPVGSPALKDRDATPCN